jgi:hypothetical protein
MAACLWRTIAQRLRCLTLLPYWDAADVDARTLSCPRLATSNHVLLALIADVQMWPASANYSLVLTLGAVRRLRLISD